MNKFDGYKEIQCIEKMSDDYKMRFFTIVDTYAGKLTDRIVMDGSAYTLHDFNNHCVDIYKIISDVLFDTELVYNASLGITPRELFILNLSVLFHDISMANMLMVKRENHAKCSAEYIQKEYDDPKSVFRKQSGLTRNELKALKAIIAAHSDDKEDITNGIPTGMHSTDLKDYDAKGKGKVRSKFLAGILRLADELDISCERLGSTELEQQLQECQKKYDQIKKNPEGQDKELQKLEGYLKSLEHWKKLYYIGCVQKKDEGRTIELVADDEYIKRCLDEGKTEKSIAGELVEIYRKIDKELQEIIKNAFAGKRVRDYIPANKIDIYTENENLKKAISDRLSIICLTETNNGEQLKKKHSSKQLPKVIDEHLEKELSQEIVERDLLKFGHFLLNDKYCARDWIDTREVVETKKF